MIDRQAILAIFETALDTAIERAKTTDSSVTMATGNVHCGIYMKLNPDPFVACNTIQKMARIECLLGGSKPVVDADISEIVKGKCTQPSPSEN